MCSHQKLSLLCMNQFVNTFLVQYNISIRKYTYYVDLRESDSGFEGNVVQGSWTKGLVYGKSAI